MRLVKAGGAILLFLLLLVMWPNIMHEPLHIIALTLQGADGVIDFDFIYPIAPTTTTTAELSAPGWILYWTFPSIISITLLWILWFSKRKATIATHVVLPLYLLFDLVLNILHYRNPYSDFRFLTLFPDIAPWLIVVVVALLGGKLLEKSLRTIIEPTNI